jgi:hypothetical protein
LTDEKPVAALFNQQQVAEVARNKTACIQQWVSWTLQEMTDSSFRKRLPSWFIYTKILFHDRFLNISTGF